MVHHGAVRVLAVGAVLVVAALVSVTGVGALAVSEGALACQGAATASPSWSSFLAAEREQETGAPDGDYNENVAGCQGAYCWRDPGVWRSMAARAGLDPAAYANAAEAPPSLQDAVVTADLYPVYLAAGGGQAGYLAAAATWNGGTTAVRANPALGPGATNYTYALEVVDKMSELGGPEPTTGAPESACPDVAGPTPTYRNPLRGVADLRPGRVDQGVDYGGAGPIYALGPGIVQSVYNAGWPEGVFIVYELTGGPDTGRGVYVAENVVPRVTVGQAISPSTVVAILRPQAPNLETGWADLSALGATQALADHQVPGKGDAGSLSTGCGQSFNALLRRLGVPGGILQPGSGDSSACP